MLLGELHRGGAVAGLADDLVALLGEHLGEVHPDQHLVLGDHDAAGRALRAGLLGHGEKVIRPPGVRTSVDCSSARLAR